jgi:hypothetical protein
VTGYGLDGLGSVSAKGKMLLSFAELLEWLLSHEPFRGKGYERRGKRVFGVMIGRRSGIEIRKKKGKKINCSTCIIFLRESH